MNGVSTGAPKCATTFTIHAEAYRIAREGFEKHRDRCRPVDGESPLQFDYESAYDPLVTAMTDAAAAAVKARCTTVSELAEKLRIFMAEEMHNRQGAEELVGFLLADAVALAGGVA